jgi:hypothetical protein
LIPEKQAPFGGVVFQFSVLHPKLSFTKNTWYRKRKNTAFLLQRIDFANINPEAIASALRKKKSVYI